MVIIEINEGRRGRQVQGSSLAGYILDTRPLKGYQELNRGDFSVVIVLLLWDECWQIELLQYLYHL